MHPNDGRVVSNFIVHALAGRPITLYGDGSQTRSFCYVDDTVGGPIRLMDSPEEVTGPINIGNPKETTVRKLAETIIARTGSQSTLEIRDLPADDPKQRRPDIARGFPIGRPDISADVRGRAIMGLARCAGFEALAPAAELGRRRRYAADLR